MRSGARSHASRVVRRISERVFPSRFAHRSRKAIFLSSRRKMQIFIFVFVFVLGLCLAILDPGLSALENRGLAIAHRPNCLELRELPQAAPSVQAGAEGLRGCDAGMILNPGHTSLPGLHRRAEGAETPDRQVDFTHGILGGQFQQPGVGSIACATAGIGYAPLYENMKMFAIPSG